MSLSHTEHIRPVQLLLKQRLKLESSLRTSIDTSTAQEQLYFRAMLGARGVLLYTLDSVLRQPPRSELLRVRILEYSRVRSKLITSLPNVLENLAIDSCNCRPSRTRTILARTLPHRNCDPCP